MIVSAVIPVYNNATTVLNVAKASRNYLDHVLVIDDGSTDWPDNADNVLKENDIQLVRHQVNKGKGEALKTALKTLAQQNVDYMIVLDADGQHAPEDLPAFREAINTHGKNKDTIFIGVRDFTVKNVPGSSIFGRNFSNFWVRLETGCDCADTQSGFRAYPVEKLATLRFITSRYNFEIEILVRAIWGGMEVHELPIKTYYQPREQRISHFRPFMDNARLSCLHTFLVLRRIMPWPVKRLVPQKATGIPSLWKSPKIFFHFLLHENATPAMLALSAAVGTFLAILPLLSCHMLVILYVCVQFKLNKVMALAIQNLFMPPLSPFICIELGYFIQHGGWLKEVSLKTVTSELHLRLLDWLVGSIIVAPVAAIISGFATFFIASKIQKHTTP